MIALLSPNLSTFTTYAQLNTIVFLKKVKVLTFFAWSHSVTLEQPLIRGDACPCTLFPWRRVGLGPRWTLRTSQPTINLGYSAHPLLLIRNLIGNVFASPLIISGGNYRRSRLEEAARPLPLHVAEPTQFVHAPQDKHCLAHFDPIVWSGIINLLPDLLLTRSHHVHQITTIDTHIVL